MTPGALPGDGGGSGRGDLLDRLLAPLRSEAAMFHVLLGVVAVAAVVAGVVLLIRAIT